VSDLEALYTRYKALALGVGAGLLLAPDEAGATARLTADTLRLASDAGRHTENDPSAAAAAAHRAALDLHRLAAAAPDAAGHARLIERVRASHRALRAELWDVVCDQYAPCGAHPHPPAEDHDHV
jgi:hypothetical protein